MQTRPERQALPRRRRTHAHRTSSPNKPSADPAPDYHVDAADHTLTAALRKAVENLKRPIRARQTKQRVKGNSHLQLGKVLSRWSSAPAGHRA